MDDKEKLEKLLRALKTAWAEAKHNSYGYAERPPLEAVLDSIGEPYEDLQIVAKVDAEHQKRKADFNRRIKERQWRLADGTSTIEDREPYKEEIARKLASLHLNSALTPGEFRAMKSNMEALRQEINNREGYQLPPLVIGVHPQDPTRIVMLWSDEPEEERTQLRAPY